MENTQSCCWWVQISTWHRNMGGIAIITYQIHGTYQWKTVSTRTSSEQKAIQWIQEHIHLTGYNPKLLRKNLDSCIESTWIDPKSVRAVLSYRYLFTCWQPDEIYQTSESVVSMLTGLTPESHSSTPSASPTAEAGTPLHHQQTRCTLRTKLAASAGQNPDHQWITQQFSILQCYKSL